MAHFVKLSKDNIVIEGYVVNNDALDPKNEEQSGIDFLTTWSNGYTNWKQTSYNGRIRKQYCGVGYSYNPDADVFISPQPFPSWSLDDNYDWQAPVARPLGDKRYYWSEDDLNWIEIIND